jgi:hypothetical protein
MVAPDGQVKVLDFGLAKHLGAHFSLQSDAATVSVPCDERGLTQRGVVVGTLSYMSPEQVESHPLDARSDVFSFGAVLYELLTGQRAFQGDSPISTMSAVLRDAPVPVHQVRADVPQALEAILDRCLEKNPDLRYASAVELHADLAACQSHLAGQRLGTSALLRQPRYAISALALLAVLIAAASWFFWRSSQVNWARTVGMPEIKRLLDEGRSCAAFRIVGRVERYLPGDPEIGRIRENFLRRASFLTDPPGADVYVRDYLDTAADAPEDYLGRTPLEKILVPAGHLRYRIAKPGLDTAEGYIASAVTGGAPDRRVVKLDAKGSAPPGMVRVPAQEPIEEFWLDTYEVTNRQFKEFVVRGGYQNADYWKGPFIRGRSDDRMGAGRGRFQGRHRQSRPRNLGVRDVSSGAG